MRRPPVEIPPLIRTHVRPWQHWGYLRRAIDGDTIRVDEVGPYGITIPEIPIRLIGVQAPERVAPFRKAWANARDQVAEWCGLHPLVWHTAEDRQDRHGRYLARVMVWDQHPPLDLSIALIAAGHARHFLVPRTSSRLSPILWHLGSPEEAATSGPRGI